MKNTLNFDAADLRRVVEHSIAAKTQGRSARTPAPDPASARPGEDEAVPAVILGHDRGVYLMSNGQPRDLIDGELSFVAYAMGCDPSRDPDWRAHCRDLVGDDDFSVTLPWANDLKTLLDAGVQTITVSIDRNEDRVEVAVRSDA